MPTAASRSPASPREVVEAFSTRRAEIEAAMAERGLGSSADNPRLAERAALMTRAVKRDIDRDELRNVWQRQAADLGLDARALTAGAMERSAPPGLVRSAGAPRYRRQGRAWRPDGESVEGSLPRQ